MSRGYTQLQMPLTYLSREIYLVAPLFSLNFSPGQELKKQLSSFPNWFALKLVPTARRGTQKKFSCHPFISSIISTESGPRQNLLQSLDLSSRCRRSVQAKTALTGFSFTLQSWTIDCSIPKCISLCGECQMPAKFTCPTRVLRLSSAELRRRITVLNGALSKTGETKLLLVHLSGQER